MAQIKKQLQCSLNRCMIRCSETWSRQQVALQHFLMLQNGPLPHTRFEITSFKSPNSGAKESSILFLGFLAARLEAAHWQHWSSGSGPHNVSLNVLSGRRQRQMAAWVLEEDMNPLSARSSYWWWQALLFSKALLMHQVKVAFQVTVRSEDEITTKCQLLPLFLLNSINVIKYSNQSEMLWREEMTLCSVEVESSVKKGYTNLQKIKRPSRIFHILRF